MHETVLGYGYWIRTGDYAGRIKHFPPGVALAAVFNLGIAARFLTVRSQNLPSVSAKAVSFFQLSDIPVHSWRRYLGQPVLNCLQSENE